MSAGLLPILEAYRTLLRSRYPKREDLIEIISADRLIYAKGFGIDPGPAHEILALLRNGVTEQKIRLIGVLNNEMPTEIHPLETRVGSLDVFNSAFSIYESKGTFRKNRTYTNIHCYAADLPIELAQRRRAGAPEKYDWEEIKLFTYQQLDADGDFAREKDQVDGWRTAADLYRRIEDHLGDDHCPGLAQLKKRVPPIVEGWRRMKAGN